MSAHHSPDDPPPRRDVKISLAKVRVYDLERLAYTDAANIEPHPRFSVRWRARIKATAGWFRSWF